MGKRRKTTSGTRYQVPSLQSLALAAVRRNEGRHFRHNLRTTSHVTRRIINMADAHMSESRSTGTQTAAQEGAKQVGQGLQVTVPRSIPHLYNNNYSVRLSYADAYNLTVSGSAGSSTRVYSTVSIYDPDVTGIGHQPLMRDLWASQYDYYTVMAFHYRIELYNCGNDAITYTAVGTSSQKVGGVVATLIRTTNQSDVTNMGTGTPFPACEMKNTEMQALWPDRSIEFSGTLTPGDFIVDAKDQDADTTWTAVGSNPAVQRYIGLAMNSVNSGGFVGASETPYSNIQVVIKFDYDVQFTQLNQNLRTTIS